MPRTRTSTVADGIRILVELDQQVLAPRPSHFGHAAWALWTLALKAIGAGIDDPELLGDVGALEIGKAIGGPASPRLRQPLLDAIELEADRAALIEAGKRLLEAIAEPNEIAREMVMDNVVQAFGDAVERAERRVPVEEA